MNPFDFHDLLRSAGDPWTFLTEHIVTQDPARGETRYPDYSFLRELVASAEAHRFLLVPKSRQMMVTWTITAYILWRVLFRGPGVFLLLSRNERCAEELLVRTRFLIEHLPVNMRPRLTTNSREEIAFGYLGSRILSLPASPNGPRMYAPSAVFWDEMAFTPFDEQIWTALKPALDSGSRFIGVSSSGGATNLFAKMILSSSPPAGDVIKGESLFHVHRIHYSQHPDRQNENWKRQAAQGLSESRWRQEQEISFDEQNDLVYSEFDPALHVLPYDWTVNRDAEIWRSIDFGFHHPFVLWIQRAPDGSFVVFEEWAGSECTTEAMLAAIHATDRAHRLTEGHIMWTACDPAGAAVQDTGLSPVDILRRGGVKLRYRASHISPGIERVKAMLRDMSGTVRLRISPRCSQLISDLRRYRWNPAREEPLKDGLCDHSMDALRYFFVNLDSVEDWPFAPRFSGIRRL